MLLKKGGGAVLMVK